MIHVRGTDREIGRQHAEQTMLGAERGMVDFYYEFWSRVISQKPSGAVSSLLWQWVKPLIDPGLVNRLLSRVPEYARERLRGVEEVTGRPYRELATALVLPDLLPLLQSSLARFKPRGFVDVSFPPSFGCSSFVASGKTFLHGRNLDFPGVGYWDRYQVIQSTQRSQGLKYIGFTTAGVPIGGITGVNEAQVSVSLHQHYCSVSSTKGDLPFLIAEEILSSARSLSESQAILLRHRVATSWAFIVCDGKTRDSFLYECHPKARGIKSLKEFGGTLAHSNFYQTPECRPKEFATSTRMNWDNFWRRERLMNLLKESGNDLTPVRAAALMSDHVDGFWGIEKICNRIVSQVYNIQSIVLDLQNMKVLMAEGDYPIHLREYVEYDLADIFAGGEGRTGRHAPGYRFQNPSTRQAKELFIQSFVSSFDGDMKGALQSLYQCLELDFSPEASYVAGIIQLKEGNFEEAETCFTRAKLWIETKMSEKGLDQFPPEYFETVLYLARTLDLLGKKEQARIQYQFVAQHPKLLDENIRRLAGKKGPYQARELGKIISPHATYVPFH